VEQASLNGGSAQRAGSRRWLRRLGLHSLRGRYLFVAAAVLIFLAAAGWLAQRVIDAAVDEGAQNLIQRQRVSVALLDLRSSLRYADSVFHDYLIAPNDARRALARSAFGELYTQMSALPNKAWIGQVGSRRVKVELLAEYLGSRRDDDWSAGPGRLRRQMAPMFENLWSALNDLENDLERDSARDVATISIAAARVKNAIWAILIIGVALLAVGYPLFEWMVRAPLARLSRALKEEASGIGGEVRRTGFAEEMHALAGAFNVMRREVRLRQRRLQTILDNAAEGIVTFDEHGRIQSVNHAAERLFNYDERELLGESLGALIPRERPEGEPPSDAELGTEVQHMVDRECEVSGRRKGGERFAAALKVSAINLDGESFYTALVADVSARKAMVERLKNVAEHDGVTGLYNRSYLQDELERVVLRAQRGDSHCALLYIDLDNFKYVNDTLGHAAGDRLLVEVAGVLERRARKSDLLARFGGDEFTVLLYDVGAAQATKAAASFRSTLADYHFHYHGQRVDIACSIGVAPIAKECESAAAILSQADVACHLAKRNGRNRVHLYDPAAQKDLAAMSLDMGWSRRIRDAIEHGGFALAQQPIVDVKSGEVSYHEVLLRLHDERRGGLIMPGGFLPAAERFGHAADIDRWVIDVVIDLLASGRRTQPGLRYAVNLSGQTLTQPDVCDLIVERLQATGLDPEALSFEITETAAIADMSVAGAFLARLRVIGCHTLLDDFGSGMSSFAYLRELPVDGVKIDGRFVRNLATSAVDQAMVRAMNQVVHALGKQTIAEFVENEETMQLLREFGVDYAQGYHLGRPTMMTPWPAADAARCREAG